MRVKGLTEETIKGYIAEALLVLMREKPYGKITIGEIAAKAGVNRSSYYRHFKSKEDIVRFYLMSIMDEYRRAYRALSTQSFRHYLRQIFTTFHEHRDDLLLIHENGLSHLLLDVLNACFRFEGARHGADASARRQFEVSYHIGGIYNNLLLWMDHGMRETPDQMTEIALSFKPESSLTLLNV